MLIVPAPGQLCWQIHSHDSTADATGVSITPGNNTKGSYAQIIAGSSVLYDVWQIRVIFDSNAVSGAARDTIVDIGIDPAGGTSYSVLIPDLLATSAGPYGLGGIDYTFPLHIPAGSSIGARASVNNGTVGTLRAWVSLLGKPLNPESLWKGSVVEAIGIVSGSSRGTLVTPGAGVEGSWTSLGTVTRQAHWWEVGYGVNDSSLDAGNIHADLSAGSGAGGQIMLIENAQWIADTSERIRRAGPHGFPRTVPAGYTIYGRIMQNATDTNTSLAAYAVS